MGRDLGKAGEERGRLAGALVPVVGVGRFALDSAPISGIRYFSDVLGSRSGRRKVAMIGYNAVYQMRTNGMGEGRTLIARPAAWTI